VVYSLWFVVAAALWESFINFYNLIFQHAESRRQKMTDRMNEPQTTNNKPQTV
jgi:hypothetical protein